MNENEIRPISAETSDGMKYYSTVQQTRNGNYMIVIREYFGKSKSIFTINKRYGFKTQAEANKQLFKIAPVGAKIQKR